jgi:phosphohistidine phosphatase
MLAEPMAMARQLWLLRHADAEPHGTRPDSDRMLTERGKRQARVAGLAFAQSKIEFAAVLASPKARARETAELALAEMGEHHSGFRLHEPLAGGFRAEQALQVLADDGAEGSVLLVGHEPDLSNVVGELTGGRVDLKKGGVAVVKLGGGGNELVLLLRPVELALIAGAVRVEV